AHRGQAELGSSEPSPSMRHSAGVARNPLAARDEHAATTHVSLARPGAVTRARARGSDRAADSAACGTCRATPWWALSRPRRRATRADCDGLMHRSRRTYVAVWMLQKSTQ